MIRYTTGGVLFSRDIVMLILRFLKLHLSTVYAIFNLVFHEVCTAFNILTGKEHLSLLRLYALLGFVVLIIFVAEQQYSKLKKKLQQISTHSYSSTRFPSDRWVQQRKQRQVWERSHNNARLLSIMQEEIKSLCSRLQQTKNKMKFLRLLPLNQVKKYLQQEYLGKGLMQNMSLPDKASSLFQMIRNHNYASPKRLVLFHGTDLDSRRNLLQQGIRHQRTQNKKYGDGFYVTPSIDLALRYARNRFQSRRFEGKRDRALTPVIMVYQIRDENLKKLVYPAKVSGNFGKGITDHLVIRPNAIPFLEPLECIIVENIIQSKNQ